MPGRVKRSLFADVDGQEWRAYAACATPEHADVVFVADGRHGRGVYDAAVAVCAGCPVRAECLDDAVAYEGGDRLAIVGVRGGLSPTERRRLWRRQAA